MKILVSTFLLSTVFNILCILLLSPANYAELFPVCLVISFMIGLHGPQIFQMLYKDAK